MRVTNWNVLNEHDEVENPYNFSQFATVATS